MITWLDAHSGAMVAILTFVLVGVTAIYAWFTKKTVDQMKRQRQEMQRQRVEGALPMVVVRWQRWDEPSGVVLTLVNEGPGTALHIKAKYVESPVGSDTGLPDECYVPALRSGGGHPMWAYPIAEGHVYRIILGFSDVYKNRFVAEQEIGYVNGAFTYKTARDPKAAQWKQRVAEIQAECQQAARSPQQSEMTEESVSCDILEI